jgi:hypothetical protein
MKKPAYFIIQFLWAFFMAAIIWFGFINTLSVNGNNRTAAMIMIGGAIFYLLLTIAYIVLGIKKVDDFGIWMIILAVAISIVTVALGFLVATGLTYAIYNAGG